MFKKLSTGLLTLTLLIIMLTGVTSATTLKFAHIYPPDHPYQTACKNIAAEVNQKSGGSLKISVYPAGQLGSEKDLVEGLATGSVDMAIAGPGELGKWYNPLLVFEAAYVFKDVDHMYRVINSEVGQNLYKKFLDKTGMRVLGTLYYGTRHVTTKNTPVRTPADLNGLKLRTPDMPQSVANAKAIGANPTPMAFSEVYTGLSQGVVDGQENPIATIASMKFNEVQNYLILTGHVVQATPIVISDRVYQSLTDKQKKILNEAVKKNVKANKKLIQKYTEEKLKAFKESGMHIIKPDKDAFRKKIKEYLPKWEEKWGEGLYEKIQNVK